MEDDGDFIVLKNAILLNRREVAAREWRLFILHNWQKLTEHLENATILMMAGRHGKENGDIGPNEDIILWNHENQIKILEEHLKEDLEKRKLRFVLLDVNDVYDQNDKVDNKVLKARILKINPSLIVISICFSEILDLRFVLEMEAIFPKLRLNRDLTMVTKGKQIHLDPTQSKLLFTLTDSVNVEKPVIITGPEGSGKSILAVEATKIKFSHYMDKYGFKAIDGKGKIRILICGASQGNDRVPVLLQTLQDQLKECQDFCTLETQAITNMNVASFDDLVSKIQDEMLVNEKYRHSIILLDELLPQFCLEEWNHLPFENTDFVIAFRHSFCNTRYAKYGTCTEMRSKDKVICQLEKRFRCSNEITSLIFYLLVHSPNVHHAEYKSFFHSLESFDSGRIPIWLELENVEQFIELTDTEADYKALKDDVMVIYDPSCEDPFSLQPLKRHCKSRNWQCYPSSDIVGSEADTVIIYDLKEFDFEAFSRAINNLIIVTVSKSKAWMSTLKRLKKRSVPNIFSTPNKEKRSANLIDELAKIKLGKHDESICEINSKKNCDVFGHVIPFHCAFSKQEQSFGSPKKLLEVKSTATSTQADKIWIDKEQKPMAYYDFMTSRLEEVQTDVQDGRRPISDLEQLQQEIEGLNCRSVHIAARNGRIDLLENLVPKLTEKNPRGENGITPLHLAAKHGHVEVVRYFKQWLTDIHPKADERVHQMTPLHCAAIEGHLEVVKMLVKSLRKNINPAQSNGKTALHIAAEYGHQEIVWFYTSQSHINPGQSFKGEFEGKTPLHYAAQEGKLSVVRHLCTLLPENPNPSDFSGDTPLHLAARCGHLKVVVFYTEEQKIVNPAKASTCFKGRTPLHDAAQNGHNNIVHYFCSILAEKNPCDEYGYTPLHLAAENGHFRVVKTIANLLEGKHPLTDTKVTPANLAKNAGHFQIANYLWHGSDGFEFHDESNLSLRKRSDEARQSLFTLRNLSTAIQRSFSLAPRKPKKATFKVYPRSHNESELENLLFKATL